MSVSIIIEMSARGAALQPHPWWPPVAGLSSTQQRFAYENILVQFSDPQKYFYNENARLVWGCSVSLAYSAFQENKQK